MAPMRRVAPRRTTELVLALVMILIVLFTSFSALRFQSPNNASSSSSSSYFSSYRLPTTTTSPNLDHLTAFNTSSKSYSFANRKMPGVDRAPELSSFYRDRFLPRPQIRLHPDRPYRYQMHNCLKGRDGSKFGLRAAGMPWSSQQRASMQMIRVYDDAAFVLACSNVRPSKAVSRDPRVNGKKLVATTVGIVDEYCLGSFKTLQLECRRDLASRFGCDFNQLGIQPPQYILANEKECLQLVEFATKHDQPWLVKPSHSLRGRGIRYFQDSASLVREITITAGGCGNQKSHLLTQNLVQEYVQNPALLDVKYKFDVRTWLLIASVDPLIIFYHDGFVRVARNAYEESSKDIYAHITNLKGSEAKSSSSSSSGGETRQRSYLRSFAETSEELTSRFGLPKNFMQNQFRKRIARAQVFAALSQFMRPLSGDIPARKGFYHTFACDSVVDRAGGVHLLECNGFPAEAQQATLDKHLMEDGQTQWKHKIALLLNLHLEPWRLMDDARPPTREENGGQPPPVDYTRRHGFWKKPPPIAGGQSFRAGQYAFGGWHLIFNELETPFTKLNACTDFHDTVAAMNASEADARLEQAQEQQQLEAELDAMQAQGEQQQEEEGEQPQEDEDQPPHEDEEEEDGQDGLVVEEEEPLQEEDVKDA